MEQFENTRQTLNNERALLTWARFTWEQRVARSFLIHANKPVVSKHVTKYIVAPIHAHFRRPIEVKTLCQSDGVCVEAKTTHIF